MMEMIKVFVYILHFGLNEEYKMTEMIEFFLEITKTYESYKYSGFVESDNNVNDLADFLLYLVQFWEKW
jgi:hypothetical protein